MLFLVEMIVFVLSGHIFSAKVLVIEPKAL